MGIVRCEHCGSKNVDVETNVDSSYSVKKGVLGTFLFGAFGSVMGIGGKKKEIKNYHCRECGWQSSKSLNSDESWAIDFALSSNNTKRLKELKSKYKNIEWSEPDNKTAYNSVDTHISAKTSVVHSQYVPLEGDYIIAPGTLVIDNETFADIKEQCDGIKRLIIPKSVVRIDTHSLSFANLIEIILDKDNEKYSSIDGNLYTKDKTTLLKYAPGKKSANFTIPNVVVSIGDFAFRDCSWLTSVVIPNSITSIGIGAFTACKGLTSVVIPNSVTSIGFSAFSSCDNLTSIEIPNSVTFIGNNAFSGCEGLTSVVIPNSVTSIGESAFRWCSSLTSIEIPDSVTSIGEDAFSWCSGLTSVVIGDSVTFIGGYAFSNCYKLVEVINKSSHITITKGSSLNGEVGYYAKEVHKGESKIVNQNGYLFYTYGGTNYLFGYVGSETDLALPENYNGANYRINNYAFYDCDGLTSVVIPDSVRSIGEGVFLGCESLTSIEIPNLVTSIDFKAFCSCPRLTTVYYRGTSEDWSKIRISSFRNSDLTNATRYYYSESEPSEEGNFWHYDENGVIVEW